MTEAFAAHTDDNHYRIGNSSFHLSIGFSDRGQPTIQSLVLLSQPQINWAAQDFLLAPVLVVDQVEYSLDKGNMRFNSFEVIQDSQLGLIYNLSNGLQTILYLKPSPDLAVWQSWVSSCQPNFGTH